MGSNESSDDAPRKLGEADSVADSLADTQELPWSEGAAFSGTASGAVSRAVDPWSEVTPTALPKGWAGGGSDSTAGEQTPEEAKRGFERSNATRAELVARSELSAVKDRLSSRALPISKERAAVPAGLSKSVALARRHFAPHDPATSISLSDPSESSGLGSWPESAAPVERVRTYPEMLSLLKTPLASPSIPHAASRRLPTPVLGTFFPTARAPKTPRARADPVDLDGMLSMMAEGLLVGEAGDGQKEVRITLRDEFFAGTELRIVAGSGRVGAVLVPPDRMTYLELHAHLDDLRGRLESRGLRVEDLRVQEPE